MRKRRKILITVAHVQTNKIVYTSQSVQKRRKILITVAQIASISMTLIGVSGAVEMTASWKFVLIQRSGILANCNEFTSA